MDVQKIKGSGQAGSGQIRPASGRSSPGDGFGGHLESRLKDDYRRRASALLDEMSALADSLTGHVDIAAFEKYRLLVRELLAEIVRNAYALKIERVLDHSGRSRVLETVSVIDEKLSALARDILEKHSDKLDYLGRVDEIRGLILDMLM